MSSIIDSTMSYCSHNSTTTSIVCRYCFPVNENWLPHVMHQIDEYLTPFFTHEIFTAACEVGASVSTLDFLLERTAPVWRDAIRAAVRGGHMYVLRWVIDRQDKRGLWKADFDHALEIAATHGHLDTVKWLFERGMDWHTLWDIDESKPGYIEKSWLYQHCSSEALMLAAEHGHLDVVQWVYSACTDTCTTYTKPIDRAVANGHLTVAQWLRSVGVEGCSTRAVDEAAKNWSFGNATMVTIGNCTTFAMDEAAGNGHFEIVKWLHLMRKQNSSQILYRAANNGHLDIVEWVYENTPKEWYSNIGWSCTGAAQGGHIDVLRWLYDHFSNTISTITMNTAVTRGHLDVVVWLSEHGHKVCKALFLVVYYGHLRVVQWLYTHFPNKFEEEAVIDTAAENGHFEIVQWLNDNCSGRCTTRAMDNAARNGHLDVVFIYWNTGSKGFHDTCTRCRSTLFVRVWAFPK